MKIKSFDIFLINENKSRNAHKFPQPTYFEKGFVFFKLNTDSNIFGLGEPNPYSGSKKEISYILNKIIFPLIKDQDVNKLNINIIKNLALKKTKNIPCLFSCIAAISNAIYEIQSKFEKKNFSQIINKNSKKESISLYASGGMIFENQEYEYLIDEAIKFKEKKFIGWKFRPKSPTKLLSHRSRSKNPPPFDVKELLIFSQKLRLAVGENFKLMVDFGSRCKNVNEAIYILDALKEMNFYFIEEPIKTKLKNYKKLFHLNKNYKIALGEYFYNNKDINNWVNINKINTFQFDSNMIIFDDFYKLSKKVYQKGLNLIPHNWYNLINNNTNISFLNSLPISNKIIEYNILNNPYKEIFVNKMYTIKRGKIVFKNHKGLGIDLNYKAIKKFTK